MMNRRDAWDVRMAEMLTAPDLPGTPEPPEDQGPHGPGRPRGPLPTNADPGRSPRHGAPAGTPVGQLWCLVGHGTARGRR